MEELPDYFDIIVVGTGITESIVAAAASRLTNSVLHIDPRDYYGGKWATLNYDQFLSGSFVNPFSSSPLPQFSTLTGKRYDISFKNDARDFESYTYTQNEELINEIKDSNRKFNIDICPKVITAREEIIQLLIESNVSRYLEFTLVNSLLSTLPSPHELVIESIPLCRSDIFASKSISLTEKRLLMKFLQSVLKIENDESTKTLKFYELVAQHSLPPKIQHLMKTAIRTVDEYTEESSTELKESFNTNFAKNCKLFLESIGRYGNKTPYLWTLYGVSEICQAFCRLSAIYGGIYILNRSIESVKEIEEVKKDEEGVDKKDRFLIVKTQGKEIKTNHLILGPEFKMKSIDDIEKASFKKYPGITLVRGVLIVHGPKLKELSLEGKETGQSVYRFNDMDIIELDEKSLATPKNYRLLQITLPYNKANSPSTPRSILESRLSQFLDFSNASNEGLENEKDDEVKHSKPVVLCGFYFYLDFYESIFEIEDGSKIISCSTSCSDLSAQVQKAREIISLIFPGDEFLPLPSSNNEVDWNYWKLIFEDKEIESENSEENCYFDKGDQIDENFDQNKEINE